MITNTGTKNENAVGVMPDCPTVCCQSLVASAPEFVIAGISSSFSPSGEFRDDGKFGSVTRQVDMYVALGGPPQQVAGNRDASNDAVPAREMRAQPSCTYLSQPSTRCSPQPRRP
jgi:hypothetical protein